MKPKFEKIELGKVRSILAFKYSEERFDAPWHFHPQHELTYIVKSHGTKFIGDHVSNYQANEIVLVKSNLPHCWKDSAECTEFSESLVVQWNQAVFPKIPELVGVNELLKKAAFGLKFNIKDPFSIKRHMEQLIESAPEKQYIGLLSILVELSKSEYVKLSSLEFKDEASSTFNARVSMIHEFIEREYSNKIKLSDLAKLTCMSEQSFSRFFGKYMGRPFFTYLNEYRINIACKMLLETDASISQVGFSCGYESLTFFHKQFVKFKQTSPNQFRKQHKMEADFNA